VVSNQFGDTFTSDNISDEDFPQFLEDDFDISTPTFYLSVNADNYTEETSEFRNAFGWAQFQTTEPGKIAMLDNAVSYGNGIIVGTTEAIPEPTTSGLGFGGEPAFRELSLCLTPDSVSVVDGKICMEFPPSDDENFFFLFRME
jgi:hypothetical protein